MRVFITGGTGFVGRALVPRLLSAGHEVVVASRSPAAARGALGEGVEIVGSAESAEGLARSLRGVDAIVNLAGEPIVSGRWTASRKRRLVESRVDRTKRLVSAIGQIDGAKPCLISASAIGYYGDRGDEALNESSERGSGFLAELCERWEGAAQAAEEIGSRVVRLRIGIVLGPGGGALQKMLLPFSLGLGGPIGSGKQYMSWIHLQDLVELIVRGLEDSNVRGVVNAVAPAPVDNTQFTRALGRALNRPTLIPAPAIGLRLALGEMSEVLLGSQRVEPKVALERGFQFAFPTIEEALEDIVSDARGVEFHRPGPLPDSDYLRRRRPNSMLTQETIVDAPIDEVFDFFSRASNLGAMTPADLRFEITELPDQMAKGARLAYRIGLGPIPMKWRTEIESWEPRTRFVDNQESGPYASWWHEHRFEAVEDRTRMKDTVYFRVPFGPLGRLVEKLVVRPMLRGIFGYRAFVVGLRFRSGANPNEHFERRAS